MGKSTPAPSHKTVGRAVPRGTKHLIRRARKALAGAAAPFGEDLHQTRTALKKARALLQLIPRGKKMRDQLGDVSRVIGSVRDAGVAVVTFDRVVQSAGLPMTPPLQKVRDRLVQRRTEIESNPDTVVELHRAERALAQQERRTKQGALGAPTWRDVKGGCKASYRKARRTMAVAYRRGTDSAFHDWRKAVKRHTYQLKGLRIEAGAGKSGVRQRDLERLGDVLGEAQDLAMFEATLRAERACFGRKGDCQRLLSQMQRQRRQLRKEAQPLGDQLFGERPAQFAHRLDGRVSPQG